MRSEGFFIKNFFYFFRKRIDNEKKWCYTKRDLQGVQFFIKYTLTKGDYKMSKQRNSDATVPRRNTHKQNRIPDVEWLFGNDEAKEKNGDKFLHKLICRDWRKILYATLLFLLQNSPVWIMPLITSDVIDTVTTRPDGYMYRLAIDAVILFVVLIQNVPSTLWRSNVQNKWIRTTTAQIKSGVMRKLQRLSITYHKEIEEGRIQSKLLRDVENVNGLIPSIFGTLISAGIAVWRSPIVALFFLVLIPCNLILVRLLNKPIRRDLRSFREENEKLSAKLTTSLQMLSIVKSHGLADDDSREVDKKIDSATTAGLRLDKTYSVFGAFSWALSHILSGVCLFFCVFLAIKDIITIGDVVLFQSLFTSISASVSGLINAFPSLSAGKDSVYSLSEIICATDIEKDDGEIPVPAIKGEITFENVCYHYPGEEKPVVSDFSLSVKCGERIAIVGASGSGKSTLMNLLIGLLSPSRGRIYIDGIPLDEMPMQAYRHFLSVVPQNSILFSGSLKENITYGMNYYTEEQLQKAIEDACIDEFLSILPNGLDSPVGERGEKLSGGQKQRVSIARALIRNPSILILDEATSALDNVSEYHVQKAIDKLLHKRTTFIVAHRLSTIRNADRIVVMEEGKAVEIGSYEELVALGGKFAELEKLSKAKEQETA